MVGVVVMGKSLAVVAVELVHALSFRSTFCGGCSESPFAEYTGNVSLRFHQAVYIIGVSRNGMLALDRQFLVAPDGCVSGVQTSDEGRARRGADRRAGVVAGEHHSIRSE